MILVDSSLYIGWMKERVDPVERLAPWIEAGQVVSCGVVRCEVVRGLREGKVLDRMTELFEVMPSIPTDEALWDQVLELVWNLDRQGNLLPLTDVVIACCALRAGATLVSTDRHLEFVPGLSLEKSLPGRLF